MKYRNKLTGAVIDVKSVMKGAWEPVEKPAPEKEAPKKTPKKTEAKKK